MIRISEEQMALACVDDRAMDILPGAFDALADTLRELAEFVASLCEADYTSQSELTGGGTIGTHVRHCLDHVSRLLDGIESGIIDYDRRERGTDLERLPHCAFDAITALEERLRNLPSALFRRPVCVRGLLSSQGPVIEVPSTVGRELMFVLSHTVHHNAMIAAAARRLGACVSPDFGYAPATIAYRNRSLCAPSRSSR